MMAGVLISITTVVYMIPTVTLNPVSCGEGYVNHQGLCCGAVSCERDFYIKICLKDRTNDTCVPCPPDTPVQPEPLTSEIIEMIEVIYCQPREHCPANTVPSSIIAPEGCRKPCRCNLEIGKCGDPCNCRTKHCPAGYELTQYCGCYPKHLKTTASVREQQSTTKRLQNNITQYFRSTTNGVTQSNESTSSVVAAQATNDTKVIGNKRTSVVPDFHTLISPSESISDISTSASDNSIDKTTTYGNEESDDADYNIKDKGKERNSYFTTDRIIISAFVILTIILPLAAAIIYIVRLKRKRRHQAGNVFIQANSIRNIQIGTNNTILTKPASSSTDPLLENGD